MKTDVEYIPPELVVIVDPEARLQIRGGKVMAGVNINDLTGLLHRESALIQPLFASVQHNHASKTTLMGVDQPLDLSMFYKVTGPSYKLDSFANLLRELPGVQAAYLKPAADISSVNERSGFDVRTPDFSDQQEYLKPAAQGGIDAEFAWTQDGGGGMGIKLIDIEGAWNFCHEDLVDNPSICVAGVPISSRKWRRHGTAVLGMLAGDHNKFGIKGICPDAEVRTVSIFNRPDADPSDDWGSARAIQSAADMLRPGDIMLLELHRPGPAVKFQENGSQFGYIPIEWWPCDMAAILYATRLRSVLVVAAAGNGQQNLCDDIYNHKPETSPGPFPFWWVNPFKRDPIDTRAILVGAGVPPYGTHGSHFGPDCSRGELSNFGAIIDAQGWGEEVATCGGNNDLGADADPENRHYTRRFHGTSSAAAMVAGALCCLQGVLRTKNKSLTPKEARRLLRDRNLGSPQQDGPFGPAHLEPIGPRPDLMRLISQF